MYLHIGMNTYIRLSRIVGIFNFDLSEKSLIFRQFLEDAKVINNGLTLAEVKSFIVTDSNIVYWSNINSRTLQQRCRKELTNNSVLPVSPESIKSE